MSWWQTYFTEAWPKIAPAAKTKDDTYLETDFIDRILSQYIPDKKKLTILDVPCGTGRIALEIAERHEACYLTGVDFNEDAIAEAEKSVKEKGLVNAEFVVGDMREMNFKEKFDAALCIFSSFGYFDDSGNEAVVAAVSNSLKSGGLFILDTHVLETLLIHFTHKDYWEFGEDLVILERRAFDYVQSRVNSVWTTLEKGKREHSYSSVRIYAYRELVELLQRHQLHVIDTFSSFEGESFDLGADQLILVCQKGEG